MEMCLPSGCSIIITKQDIIDVVQSANSMLKIASSYIDKHRKQEFTIAIIDDRYKDNGYIISWGIVDISPVKLEKYLNSITYPNNIFYIHDIFDEKDVKFETSELSGYEVDTPIIFDFKIKS